MSGQAIYLWEAGKARPRASLMPASAALCTMGERQATELLSGCPGSLPEPVQRHARCMITLRFWLHTCPRTGRRRRSCCRLSEDEARHQLVDPVPIEADALTVGPLLPVPSGHWRSGLVRRADGALVAPKDDELPQESG